MTHECRRAQVKDEHAVKQSSGPKPISQSDGQVIHILRERIEKDILDKTKKALMKFNDNRERASSAERDGPSTGRIWSTTRTEGTTCSVAELLRMGD